jgi:monoamine oxidase
MDAIVIGAGAAGLAAARLLREAGLEVIVLEARARLGGRIHTLHEPGWPMPIEAGAEFVHGAPPRLMRVLALAGLETRPSRGSHLLAEGGRLRRADRLWREVQQLLAHVGGPERTVREYFDSPGWKRRTNEEQRWMAAAFVEGFDALDLDRASLRAIAEESSGGAERIDRVVQGYGALVDWLAAGTRVVLRAPATRVLLRDGEVEVRTRRRAWRARTAIVTLPLAVLQAGALQFRPALPPRKQQAIDGLAMGAVVKVALRLERPLLGRALFLHARSVAVPTWWVPRPLTEHALIGWAAGPRAEALPRTDAAIARTALESLRTALGAEIPLSAPPLVFDWRRDEYARGAYSWVPVGQLKQRQELAAPVGKQLFFAGEATSSEMSGTVHGALESGFRAAGEVLAALPA